jgi:hypothetical protein
MGIDYHTSDPVSIRLTDDERRWLAAREKETGLSRTRVISLAIAEHRERIESQETGEATPMNIDQLAVWLDSQIRRLTEQTAAKTLTHGQQIELATLRNVLTQIKPAN